MTRTKQAWNELEALVQQYLPDHRGREVLVLAEKLADAVIDDWNDPQETIDASE
jgi:hypothetical protein